MALFLLIDIACCAALLCECCCNCCDCVSCRCVWQWEENVGGGTATETRRGDQATTAAPRGQSCCCLSHLL